MPYELCEHDPTLDYIEQQMASRGITQQEVEETRAQTEMEMLQFLREQVEANVPLTSIHFDSEASALHVAAANGYLDVVELLLEHNFPTNVVDADLWQPVHAAACWGHVNT
jgi:protein phosphatase 1 regulatory subunit 16A